ncbi:MAG: hypothetical protein CHACPFDD_00067 [Phycisphaerae bacterium]|nr:hypothetical protein [Phycisphaerae bacterium]
MDPPTPPTIQIRCVCGKRYRVKNAQVGFRASCPSCGSLIEVTPADLVTGFTDDGLIRMSDDAGEARDAILVSPEPIRLAGKGAQPGLTGAIKYTSEDALLSAALTGRAPATFGGGPGATLTTSEPPPAVRTFVGDLFSSFLLAGNRNNAIYLAIGAAWCTALIIVTMLIPFIFKPIVIPGIVLLFIYLSQSYWQVLRMTAQGDDEIPWFASDLDLTEDVVRPTFWVGLVSLFCSTPAMIFASYAQASISGPALHAGVALFLLAGWFFWPVALMSIAIGQSVWFLRPDWLVRCVVAIGPSYALAWLLAAAVVVGGVQALEWVGWLASLTFGLHWSIRLLALFVFPAVTSSVSIYLGYVLFRTIGLLYRHHGQRFPWRF